MKQKQTELDISVKFKPPTLEMVKQEAVFHLGIPIIEAEKFFAYHSAGGWMIGRNRMKSWKDALAYWKLNMRHDELKKARSVFELTKIIEAKQRLNDELKRRFSSEVSTGRKWTNESARLEFVAHNKEIQALTKQIAGM